MSTDTDSRSVMVYDAVTNTVTIRPMTEKEIADSGPIANEAPSTPVVPE